MVASISSSTVSNWSDSLFNKLDTKKQGYIDTSDLATALGADSTDSATNDADAANMLKQIDGDGDGKITKSELSTAISKVSDELNAQFDASRVDKSQAGTPPDGPPPAPPAGATSAAASTGDTDDTLKLSSTSASSSSGAAQAAPAGGGGSTSSTDTNKYVQAADTDANGKISDDEAAAYKKLMASQAEKTEHKHGPHHGEKADASDSADSTGSDKDLSRALDMLKQYVNNSGSATSSTATSTISESA